MKYPILSDAARYSKEILPSKKEIYNNGSSVYSNFRTLVLHHEFGFPECSYDRIGILREIDMIWYSQKRTLYLYRYDINTTETVPNFSSIILHVECFKPTPNIFNDKINFCLLVLTETDSIIYAIEKETHNIINTEFSVKLYSKPTCIDVKKGNIYIGCQDGNVYQAIYKSIDFFNYKYMNLYSSGSFMQSLCKMFKRKQPKVYAISSGEKYLVALGRKITVYNIEGGMYVKYTIDPICASTDYSGIQIIEESPLLFSCVLKNGNRDFYSTEYLYSKDVPLSEIAEATSSKYYSKPLKLLSLKTCPDNTLLVLTSFNSNQLRNFTKSNPVENYEVINIYSQVVAVALWDTGIIILTTSKISFYEILDSKMLLLNSRAQETYLLYKNYGDVEFSIKYFELLAENEDVSKIEGLCKNESAKIYSLFIYLYNLIKPVWDVDIYKLKSEDSLNYKENKLDEIVSKLKILKNKIGLKYEEAKCFIDEFIQTKYYISILVDYNIQFKETFESILTRESSFKTDTLKALLDICSMSQNIDALIKVMKNNCPMYLPLDQINLQRGLELFKKDTKESYLQSLEYLKNAPFDLNILKKFKNAKFYYGCVFLIKEHFTFSYEEAVNLFKECVKCKKSLEYGLSDSRESFLFPFFEVVVELERFEECSCCESASSMVDLLKIENSLFITFLRDNHSLNEKVYNLYWKYLLYRNKRIEAAEALIQLSQRQNIDLEKKVEFLTTALSVSNGTKLQPLIKLKLKLYEVQSELMRREPSLHLNNLLSADSLLNDYCYKYSDLCLRIFDIVNFDDKIVIKEKYTKYFKNLNFSECIKFLKTINKKELELVVDILVEKVDSSTNICHALQECGFEYNDIIVNIRNVIMGGGHPDVKSKLVSDLDSFSKNNEAADCIQFCAVRGL